MIPHDLPSAPWQNVGTDLFELNGQHFVIIADNNSKMLFVRRISSESSKTVTAELKNTFSEHGIPETLFSDGGLCYARAGDLGT